MKYTYLLFACFFLASCSDKNNSESGIDVSDDGYTESKISISNKLPSEYFVGQNPKTAWQAIKNAVPPKTEFETADEYKKRFLETIENIKIIGNLTTKDNLVYVFKIGEYSRSKKMTASDFIKTFDYSMGSSSPFNLVQTGGYAVFDLRRIDENTFGLSSPYGRTWYNPENKTININLQGDRDLFVAAENYFSIPDLIFDTEDKLKKIENIATMSAAFEVATKFKYIKYNPKNKSSEEVSKNEFEKYEVFLQLIDASSQYRIIDNINTGIKVSDPNQAQYLMDNLGIAVEYNVYEAFKNNFDVIIDTFSESKQISVGGGIYPGIRLSNAVLPGIIKSIYIVNIQSGQVIKKIYEAQKLQEVTPPAIHEEPNNSEQVTVEPNISEQLIAKSAEQIDNAAVSSSPEESEVKADLPVKPSFDCAKAITNVEFLICSNNRLSALDARLAETYKVTISASNDSDAIKTSQKNWNKLVKNACKDVQCLDDAYTQRISDLMDYLNK